MRRLLVAIALSALIIPALASPAWAQVEGVSTRTDRATVVIYRDRLADTSQQFEALRERDPSHALYKGLALIVETRTIDIPAGESVLRFEGLAGGIMPETATLDGLPGPVLERNTDFELLSPGGLLQHSIGDVVQVVQTNRQNGAEVTRMAVVRSGANGPVLEIDGRIEALGCQGLTQRIIFDHVPEGLGHAPTLSVRTRSAEAGRHTVRLAYLARGLDWTADYVARIAPDGRSMAVEGWITLMNFGVTGFTDAPVYVVAGNLNETGDTEALEPLIQAEQSGCWPMDVTGNRPPPRLQVRPTTIDYLATIPSLSNSAVDESQIDEIVVTGSRIQAALANLGDYKIYALPEPTDVNPHQAKQVRFFDQPDVRFDRTYSAMIGMDRADDEAPPPVQLLIRMRNDASQGLGVPMPGGGFSLMETQDGAMLLTGQSSFVDRGAGTPLELRFGEAMDVHVAYELLDEEDGYNEGRDGDISWTRVTAAVTVTNDKGWPVEIELLPDWSDRPGFRILEQSQRSMVTPGGATGWRVRVPANATRSLRFTARIEN